MYESKDIQECISMEVGLDATAKRFYRRWKNEQNKLRRYEFTERYFWLIYSNTVVWNARYENYPELSSSLHSQYCHLSKLWNSIDDEWNVTTILEWFEQRLGPYWEFIAYHAAFLSVCDVCEQQLQNRLSGE